MHQIPVLTGGVPIAVPEEKSEESGCGLCPISSHTLMKPIAPMLHEKNPLVESPNRVRVINRGLGGIRPKIDADVFGTLTQALLSEMCCQLTYQARSWPQPEQIIVQPLGSSSRSPLCLASTILSDLANVDVHDQVQTPMLAMHH